MELRLASDSMEWSAFPFFYKERQRLFTQFFTIGDFPIQFSVYTQAVPYSTNAESNLEL